MPTTQELWFIEGHCRHPGAAPIILWPKSSSPTQEQAKEDVTSTNADQQELTDNKAVPLKKKRIRPHTKKLTANQKLRKQEQGRINSSPTPLQRSVQYTLPEIVDKDKAQEYYKSWEPVQAKPAQIALIRAYTIKRHLQNPDNVIIAISIKDIIAQHNKDNAEEQNPSNLLPFELQEFADTFSGKAANTLPPHQEGVNHHIELEPDKQPNWTPRFYRSTQEEIEEVKR
jgi:hypothetical protein